MDLNSLDDIILGTMFLGTLAGCTFLLYSTYNIAKEIMKDINGEPSGISEYGYQRAKKTYFRWHGKELTREEYNTRIEKYNEKLKKIGKPTLAPVETTTNPA